MANKMMTRLKDIGLYIAAILIGIFGGIFAVAIINYFKGRGQEDEPELTV